MALLRSTAGKKRRNVASTACIALSCLLVAAGLSVLLQLMLRKEYALEALSNTQRISFSVSYDSAGNAYPENLEGEALDLETALAMAELAAAQVALTAIDEEHAASGATAEEAIPEDSAAEETASEAATDTAPADTSAVDAPSTEEAAAPTATTSNTDSSDEAPPPATSEASSSTDSRSTADTSAQAESDAAPDDSASVTTTPAATLESDAPILAPVERMTEQGIMPVIAPDGTMAWQYFAAPTPADSAGKPRIAVLVKGLGLARSVTEAAIALPAQVSLSFSPYGREAAAALAEDARDAGHEILLDLPMQTARYPAVDPGPYGIRTDIPAAENTPRLLHVLTRMRGYVGLAGTNFDSVSEKHAHIVPLIEAISGHGLLFVSGHTQPPEGMFRVARNANTPMLMTDIFADERMSDLHIRNQLARAEDRARSHGTALVTAKAYPLSLDLLAGWLATLEQKGFALVPVTTLGKEQNR